MNLKTRPATTEDKNWLEPFYESLMRPYVELTHTWDETLFKKYFDPNKVSILQVEGQDIGMIIIEYFDTHIYLADMQIDSNFQGKGIGSKLLQSLIEKANLKSCPIRLKVLNGNPARNLYEKHGFKLYEEQEYSVSLEYKV